jgi:hypothetical protein
MGLESTFRHLSGCLLGLQKKVIELQEFVDCKPEYDQAAVADDFSDKTLELQGSIQEARRWARSGLHAVTRIEDLGRARWALGRCQAKFRQIEQTFAEHLVSYDKLKELARVRGRDPDWSSWSKRVSRGITECRAPLALASEALASCWQELADRAGLINISVRNTGMVQNLAGARMPVGEDECYVEEEPYVGGT